MRVSIPDDGGWHDSSYMHKANLVTFIYVTFVPCLTYVDFFWTCRYPSVVSGSFRRPYAGLRHDHEKRPPSAAALRVLPMAGLANFQSRGRGETDPIGNDPRNPLPFEGGSRSTATDRQTG